MYLKELKTGERAVIKEIMGGINLRRKLVQLGLIPGTEVKIVENRKFGPVIIEVFGTRLIIGEGMAGKVVIK